MKKKQKDRFLNHDDQTVHLLLVEDDDVDAEAVIRAFRKNKIANPFTVVPDGIEALKVLRGEDGRKSIPRPYMILLDLNMPRMNGLEFLSIIRKDPELHDSIVFVLTTSSAEKDIVAAYGENVAGYLVKSEAGESFFNMVEMLQHYWRIVEFPPPKKS
jgi:CheY-like chemotaxis protein